MKVKEKKPFLIGLGVSTVASLVPMLGLYGYHKASVAITMILMGWFTFTLIYYLVLFLGRNPSRSQIHHHHYESQPQLQQQPQPQQVRQSSETKLQDKHGQVIAHRKITNWN